MFSGRYLSKSGANQCMIEEKGFYIIRTFLQKFERLRKLVIIQLVHRPVLCRFVFFDIRSPQFHLAVVAGEDELEKKC